MTQAGTPIGLRERKRRETLQRITDAGIRLFVAQGYEATTLDEIAATSGISRRTFFHYFRSKDDILLSLQSGIGDMLVAALRAAPPANRPVDAIRHAMLAVCGPLPAHEIIALDRLMRSSEAVRARKQATYVAHETALLAALQERWPDPAREPGLRIVAMLALGAMRLAFDALIREDGRRPIATLLDEAFDALEREI